MTRDTWHITCDMCWVGSEHWTFSQNVSSLALPVLELEVTCDPWHLTPDTWHVTQEIWRVSHRGWGTSCQSLRSLAQTVWKSFKKKKDWEKKDLLLTQLLNYKGVCRTAPATPGLLFIIILHSITNIISQTHGPPRSVLISFYSTTLAEHALHCLRRCQPGTARPSAGLGHVCSRLFSKRWMRSWMGGHMTRPD